MSKQITVYSKPNCQQCNFTKKWLKDNNLEFKEVDVFENEEAKQYLQDKGFQSLPVVEVEGLEPWFGFNPDKLAQLEED
ncbi:TPA: glutaredoxin-like protein NrdH [Streptococcus suis]